MENPPRQLILHTSNHTDGLPKNLPSNPIPNLIIAPTISRKTLKFLYPESHIATHKTTFKYPSPTSILITNMERYANNLCKRHQLLNDYLLQYPQIPTTAFSTTPTSEPRILYGQLKLLWPAYIPPYWTYCRRFCDIESTKYAPIIHGLREDAILDWTTFLQIFNIPYVPHHAELTPFWNLSLKT